MKGLVYHGPGKRSWDEVPDPTIEVPTDVVVRIDSSTICRTDLHILKGDVPEVRPGTILGHEPSAQSFSTDITSLFHAGVSRAVTDAISVNVDVVARTRRMINAAERRVPLDAVRIRNQKT